MTILSLRAALYILAAIAAVLAALEMLDRAARREDDATHLTDHQPEN